MTTLLRADNVRVEFGDLVAVRDVTMAIAGGQLVGLVGPNGAGKTTLLRVLCGLQPPTRGDASIMDKPVLGEEEVVRHEVGFAPDASPAYDELTIEQFLGFIGAAYGMSAYETQERIDFWLDKLWLVEKRSTLVKNLSRGMKQRVSLARTFLPQPHVLLLDEPLSGLDPAGRIQLRNVLAMLRDQGCAMIVSSHILSDLEAVATHIAIIEHGSILRFSETENIHHHDVMRRAYRVHVLKECEACADFLRNQKYVEGVMADNAQVTFTYVSGDEDAAELLRAMIAAGVAVTAFQPIKRTLEDAYLSAGLKQVD